MGCNFQMSSPYMPLALVKLGLWSGADAVEEPQARNVCTKPRLWKARVHHKRQSPWLVLLHPASVKPPPATTPPPAQKEQTRKQTSTKLMSATVKFASASACANCTVAKLERYWKGTVVEPSELWRACARRLGPLGLKMQNAQPRNPTLKASTCNLKAAPPNSPKP